MSLNIPKGSRIGKLACSIWLELRGEGMSGVLGGLCKFKEREGFGTDIVLRCPDLCKAVIDRAFHQHPVIAVLLGLQPILTPFLKQLLKQLGARMTVTASHAAFPRGLALSRRDPLFDDGRDDCAGGIISAMFV
ncbi:hypothetical protein QFC19_001873 [Naganishia cerealis]|uniref:Uncharacterized protein n=1 Tax=Naganishia cerealis TaxID=610337 RepID=A0ACC2WEQ6_9TREE|nr:hypothetical protein QFC19_001873 [Naganishia cerealis]